LFDCLFQNYLVRLKFSYECGLTHRFRLYQQLRPPSMTMFVPVI
jgi:hypothetical protein